MLSRTPDTIVTFGDSLSDSGAVFGLTSALFVDPLAIPVPGPLLSTPGYAGVFSDGPVHTQRLAAELGAGLDGYAVGGARAAAERSAADTVGQAAALIDPLLDAGSRDTLLSYGIDLAGQSGRFLGGEAPFPGAQPPLAASGDTVLATVFIGLNDFAAFADDIVANPLGALLDAPGFLLDLAGATRDTVRDIAASPLIDQVALYLLPSLGVFPTPDGTDSGALAFADGLVDTYNAGLRLLGLELELTGAAEVEIVRSDLILEEIAADPGTFGFLSEGPYYLGTGTPNVDLGAVPPLSFAVTPEVAELPLRQVVFLDEVHPTATVHSILGAFGTASLTRNTLFLDDGDNLRFGGTGDDLVLAGDGDDRIFLSRGEDIALGGRGDDKLYGQGGDDILVGGSGDDDLRGGRGDDLLAGGDGDDLLIGNSGDDLLIGGRGSDVVAGHGGDDVMLWIDPRLTGGDDGSRDVFYGGRGRDTLYLVSDTAGAADLQAAITALDPAATAFGAYDLSAHGIRAFDIEEVVVLSGGLADLQPGAELIGAPGTLLSDAAAWGLV
ncbi:MAG: Phospholipase/lecithinase/hemolysin [Rhodobacteraceae bacterium HLUCCA09]|nr:MAG: Phospholipase/lecithinase/hemolysin [Rhodobacteraceae bacterium HLUCCA09]